MHDFKKIDFMGDDIPEDVLSVFRRINVLVVDDQSFVRTLVRRMLRYMKCKEVFVAESGRAALEILEKTDIDVILCDINMRPMNGFELIARVRCGQTKAPANLPVIMLTGHDDREMMEAADALKVQFYIHKPVAQAELAEKVYRSAIFEPDFHSLELKYSELTERLDEAKSKRRAPYEEVRTPSEDDLKTAKINMGVHIEDDHYAVILRPVAPKDGSDIKLDEVDYLIVLRPLDKLAPGDVLGRDLLDRDGDLLIRSGTVLDEEHISFLKDVS